MIVYKHSIMRFTKVEKTNVEVECGSKSTPTPFQVGPWATGSKYHQEASYS